jgi:hypothetical protein
VSSLTQSPATTRKTRPPGADSGGTANPVPDPVDDPQKKAKPRPRHFAEVAHAVHGRLRLKIPAAKRDPGILGPLKAAIGRIEGVDAVEVKEGTGSIVIYYDREHHPEVAALLTCITQTEAAPVTFAPNRPPPTKLDDLTKSIEDEAGFLAQHSVFARTVVSAVKRLDKDIKRSTNNNLDLKIMVPVALAGVTFLEIGAAAATPMWITLAIFSLNHFVELHAHDADEK